MKCYKLSKKLLYHYIWDYKKKKMRERAVMIFTLREPETLVYRSSPQYECFIDNLKLAEIDSEATKEKVLKKINSLRSCSRKEWKKVKNSKKSGNGTEDIYTPNLWYYDELLFLMDQEIPRSSVDTLDSPDMNVEQDDVADELENCSHESLSEMSLSDSSSRLPKKRKKKTDQCDEVLNLVAEKLKSTDGGKYSSYAKHIAQKLECLPKEMAIFCEKIINEAIFEAEMGTLNRSSRVVTNPVRPSTQVYSHIDISDTSPSNTSNIGFIPQFQG